MKKKYPNSVPATKIKNNFGYYADYTIHTGNPIFVERHHRAVVVMMSLDAWQNLTAVAPKKESVWIQRCKKLAAEIQQTHPKQTPAVDLIREIRNEA